jgi:biopolymer transport protein ExbB
MKPLLEMIHRGGPVMYVILTLSVVLYAKCFKLIVTLVRTGRRLDGLGSAAGLHAASLRAVREDALENYRQQRVALGSMIAAAPLLGLLGTVSGMVLTFESLSGRSADKTMEVLARGISEVLVATESGLVVAIPALLLVHVATRSMRRVTQRINQLERRSWLPSQP